MAVMVKTRLGRSSKKQAASESPPKKLQPEIPEDPTLYKRISEKLKEIRGQRAMTLKEVEEKSGISNAYLSQIEQGKLKYLTFNFLVRLAEAYSLSVCTLVDPDQETLPRMFRPNVISPDHAFILECFRKTRDDDKKAFKEYLRFLTQKELPPGAHRVRTTAGGRIKVTDPSLLDKDGKIPPFAAYITKLRHDHQLDRKQVQIITGISHSYLSQFERGKRGIPTLPILFKLAKVYDVPVRHLVMVAEAACKSEALPPIPPPDVVLVLSDFGFLTEEHKKASIEYLEYLVQKSKLEGRLIVEKD